MRLPTPQRRASRARLVHRLETFTQDAAIDRHEDALVSEGAPSILAVYRKPKYAAFLGIGAFAGVALWLLVPGLLGGTGATGGQVHVSGVDALSLSPAQVVGGPNGDLVGVSAIGDPVSGAIQPSLKVDGLTQIEARDNVIRLVVPLTDVKDQAIDLTDDTGEVSVVTTTSGTSIAVFPAKYTITWLDGNGDHTLDPGEHVVLTVDLPAAAALRPNNPLTLMIKSSSGARLVIENVLAN